MSTTIRKVSSLVRFVTTFPGLKSVSIKFFLSLILTESVGAFCSLSPVLAQNFPMDPIYGSAEVGGVPIGSSFVSGDMNGGYYQEGEIPFNNGFISQQPIMSSPQFSTSIPQQSGATGTNFTANDGSNYTILGDVTQAFPVGSGLYDNIPFLNEGTNVAARKLPPLKVPQNDEEFIARVDSLLARFSNPNLSIQQSTPGRLLRYSLIGGADETFLAPEGSSNSKDVASSNAEQKPMYTLGALCWNLSCANRNLMRVANGRPIPAVGYGFQTQRGEFLATLAFAQIDRNYELRVEGQKFTVQDLVEWEKYSCSSSANLSLVAVGLAHYSQNPDEVWLNQFGEEWSLAKILEQESRRSADWNASDAIDKLTAFTYLLARLKQSQYATSPQLSPILQRTEKFLIWIKGRVWELFGDDALCNSLFFNTDVKLETPYMKLYVNGKLLRWLTFVSSPTEIQSPKMKRANAELCALVDQLFNSLDNLSGVSPTDEESFAVALQALALYRRQTSPSANTSSSAQTND